MPYTVNPAYSKGFNGNWQSIADMADAQGPTRVGAGSGYAGSEAINTLQGAGASIGSRIDNGPGGAGYGGALPQKGPDQSVIDSGRTSPDDWINLQRYFGLNQGQGYAQGSKLIQDSGAGAAVSGAQNTIKGVAGGTIDPMTGYSSVDAGANALNRVGSQYGRETMFQQGAKGPYNQGDSRLDSFLSGGAAQDYQRQAGDLYKAFGVAVPEGQAARAQAAKDDAERANADRDQRGGGGPMSDQDWAKSQGLNVDGDGNVRVPLAGGGYQLESLSDYRRATEAQGTNRSSSTGSGNSGTGPPPKPWWELGENWF